jgi:Tol biopolymer transport system component
MAAMRKLMVGVAAAAAAVLATVFALAATRGSSATDNGLIVFPGTPEGSTITQLFSITPGGSNLKQLTKSGTSSYDPVFSPAGTRLAFVRFGYGIYTMNPDGTGLRRLTTGARDTNPAWSPDGKTVAFIRPKGTAWKLWTVAVKGGKPRNIGLTPPAGRPSWIKAGLIVPTGGDLISVNPKTGRVLKYWDASVDAVWGLNSVSVSPTAGWVTYTGTRDPIPGDMECGDGPCQRYGLFLENLKAKKKIGKLWVKDAGAAAFSPDAKRAAYVTAGQLWVQTVGGSAKSAVSTPGVTPNLTVPPAWK